MRDWLRNTLKEVHFSGCAIVNKAHLLDSVGYSNDADGAWRQIAEDYEEVAGSSAKLYYARIGDRVILSRERLHPAA